MSQRAKEGPFQIFEHAIDEGVDFVGSARRGTPANTREKAGELFSVHEPKIELALGLPAGLARL